MPSPSRSTLAGFTYLFRPSATTPSAASPALLLLHGTGGDEADLLPIASALAPNALLRRAAPESPAPLSELAGAILLRPMVTFDPAPGSLPDLTGRRVLLLHGEADPTVPPHHREALARAFTTAGAEARSAITGRDHALHQRDLDTAAAWLAER